ncbi:hypothetical protein ACFL54_08830 [Planctomycetota bacterium]
MITTPTVLILGAGASFPYGFPLGKTLVSSISNKYVHNTDSDRDLFLAHLSGAGHSPKTVEEFTQALYYSGKTSVDAFLEIRTKYKEVGKAVMAQFLICHEDEKLLFTRNEEQGHWYHYLFGLLSGSDLNSYCANQLTILTFNYDRSLDHFLYTSLTNTYGCSQQECVNAMKSVPIIHLHGQLGNLPWQGSPSRPYAIETKAANIFTSADGIRIIHESTSTDTEFNKARSYLEEAKIICFLGFGYNKNNIERLKIEQYLQSKIIIGSAMHLTREEMNKIEGTLLNKDVLKYPDCGNLEFLRETGILL